MERYDIHCFSCGCNLDIDDVVYFDDRAYCPDCLDEVTTHCSECGRRIYRGSNYGNDFTTLCESCYDSYYTTCTECGALILRDDAYYVDEEDDDPLCYNCSHNCMIHNYSYKPRPIFYGGEKELFLGVELEVDAGDNKSDCARELHDFVNKNHVRIYMKNDGSLTYGFEIVTHPMTLEYHKNQMPWKEILQKVIDYGFKSHKTDTCGLHVHVNRTAFGESYEEQEANISKVLFLIEKYWEELLRFSRRSNYQINQWAARYGFKERPIHIMNEAKKCGLGRYACVNLTNAKTVEFRMWRGTLKYNTLLATLQMVGRLCKVAFLNSEKELQEMSWWSFVRAITEEELITYLKERSLYINEPVETEEDE